MYKRRAREIFRPIRLCLIMEAGRVLRIQQYQSTSICGVDYNHELGFIGEPMGAEFLVLFFVCFGDYFFFRAVWCEMRSQVLDPCALETCARWSLWLNRTVHHTAGAGITPLAQES